MGNPFVHIELSTDDDKAAKKFYQKLFDWKWSTMKMPDGEYHGIDVGARGAGGGLQKKPMPQMPTTWLPYVEVADVAKSLAKAAALGARIALPATPIGEMGAIGVFVDPTGASLGVWAPARKAAKRPAKAAKRPAKAAKKPGKTAKKPAKAARRRK
jgi:predicted enzyme related to lactoylglutathione lyase